MGTGLTPEQKLARIYRGLCSYVNAVKQPDGTRIILTRRFPIDMILEAADKAGFKLARSAADQVRSELEAKGWLILGFGSNDPTRNQFTCRQDPDELDIGVMETNPSQAASATPRSAKAARRPKSERMPLDTSRAPRTTPAALLGLGAPRVNTAVPVVQKAAPPTREDDPPATPKELPAASMVTTYPIMGTRMTPIERSTWATLCTDAPEQPSRTWDGALAKSVALVTVMANTAGTEAEVLEALGRMCADQLIAYAGDKTWKLACNPRDICVQEHEGHERRVMLCSATRWEQIRQLREIHMTMTKSGPVRTIAFQEAVARAFGGLTTVAIDLSFQRCMPDKGASGGLGLMLSVQIAAGKKVALLTTPSLSGCDLHLPAQPGHRVTIAQDQELADHRATLRAKFIDIALDVQTCEVTPSAIPTIAPPAPIDDPIEPSPFEPDSAPPIEAPPALTPLPTTDTLVEQGGRSDGSQDETVGTEAASAATPPEPVEPTHEAPAEPAQQAARSLDPGICEALHALHRGLVNDFYALRTKQLTAKAKALKIELAELQIKLELAKSEWNDIEQEVLELQEVRRARLLEVEDLFTLLLVAEKLR